jgi:hypothetical protein
MPNNPIWAVVMGNMMLKLHNDSSNFTLLKLEHPQGLHADVAETNLEHNAPNSTSLSGGINIPLIDSNTHECNGGLVSAA